MTWSHYGDEVLNEQAFVQRFGRVFNFRDLGGLPARAGAAVRAGRLFRSDSLHGLDDADREMFTGLGIRTVLDLRRPYEVERDGRVPDWDGLIWRHIHPEHREWTEHRYEPPMDLARYLADRYLDLTQEGAPALAAAVALIADPAAAPLVVHCVAGKDRTGVVCALALSLLGVSDVDIAADYGLSTAGMRRYVGWLRAQRPELFDGAPRPDGPAGNGDGGNGGTWLPLSCPPEAMRLFLADLRDRHGSVTAYLTGAGLPPAAVPTLRAHLLS